MNRRFWYAFFAVCAALLITGCASRYFRNADVPLEPPPRYELGNLPVDEYWTGVVFNGSKIGFTHFTITPSKTGNGHFEIRSQAFFRLRFLMIDKSVSLMSCDQVDSSLHLVRFSYDYEIDGNRLKLTGISDGGILKISRSSKGVSSEEEFKVQGELFPGSVIYLYPLLHGLKIGQRYEYSIFDSEAQCITPVTQEILAYQESDLFTGEAFKMKTGYQGQEMTTWIDHRGLPLLETALGGVLVSGLESEQQAKRCLLESSLNKDENLLAFSLIKVKGTIPDPSATTYLEIFLEGVPNDVSIPSDTRQECEKKDERILCRIRENNEERQSVPASGSDDFQVYLKPGYTIPSSNREISTAAREIAGHASTQKDRIHALLIWIGDNIEKEPVDVFSALDVLSGKKAECQGHAYLYAAFARSLGIPTRIANGIVYSEEFKGFLYHAWAESYVEGGWVSVDPTMNQMPADATHIKFVEGETLSSLVPLVNLMGKIGIEVVRAR